MTVAVPGAAAAATTIVLDVDTGTSGTDNITSNDALEGVGRALSNVVLTGAVTTTVTSDASGNWSFDPTGLADGVHTVTGHVVGNFPGSPVDLRYHFRLERGRIASLEITA